MSSLNAALQVSDPSELPGSSQRALVRWYTGSSHNVTKADLRKAWAALQWVSTVGAIDYLPKEDRTQRILAGSAMLGLDASELVRLIVRSRDLDMGPDSAAPRLIVALEGLDSSGKTTQGSLLLNTLASRSPVALVSFP